MSPSYKCNRQIARIGTAGELNFSDMQATPSRFTHPPGRRIRARMAPTSCILSEPYAGLQAQALGLAEAAGLSPAVLALHPQWPWRLFPAASWPAPLRAVGLSGPPAALLFTAGGTAGAIGAALRPRGARVVQVQNPRMSLRKFDLVVANRHDGLAGPNVIVTRTALHRATPARLAEARAIWAPRLAHLPRPLVAVLVGGSNGRFRLEAAEGERLAAELAGMMALDRPGVALTPSRRTAPAVRDALRRRLEPLGAWMWDMEGENPYFGLLALADVIVATLDSISMVSEAAATRAPVLLAELPGRSRRISQFLGGLLREDRVRIFAGRLKTWPVQPIDDTGWAGAEVARRLGLSGVG
jgi:mitochondrial fission protein ELM1